MRSITNWLWFIDLPGRDSVLDMTTDSAPLSEQLGTHFAEVRAGSWEALSEGTPADCIVFDDETLRARPDGTTATDSLARLRESLSPGGWLVGTCSNAAYLGRGQRGSAGTRPSVMSRRLRHAGFRDIRRLYLTPSIIRPWNVIPDDRDAVRAFETSPSMKDALTWTRRVVVNVGLNQLLYPAYVVLARA